MGLGLQTIVYSGVNALLGFVQEMIASIMSILLLKGKPCIVAM